MLCYWTPLAVTKDDKIVQNQNGALKVPLFDLLRSNMSCLDAKISLVPIVPSTLLAPATHIPTDKATKIQTLRPLTHVLFFQNSLTKTVKKGSSLRLFFFKPGNGIASFSTSCRPEWLSFPHILKTARMHDWYALTPTTHNLLQGVDQTKHF